MARKSKRRRKTPPASAPTPAPTSRGTTDRDKAIAALMALLAERSFEQIGLAEVAGHAGIKLSQSTARSLPAATSTWPRSRRASAFSTC
jgi:AcrR family transcriptional regulator